MLSDVSLKPTSGQTDRAVIIVHGLGDSAEGIIGLGEAYQAGLPNTEFLAPNAPFPCEFSPFGYQWFSANNWTPSVILEGIRASAPTLNEYIDHVLTTRSLAPRKLALVGFSQGTMMGLYVAPRRPQALAGVLGYSGALFGEETLAQQRTSNPPVMLVHGTHDDVVPFSALNHAVAGLRAANMNVEAITCPGVAHSIDNLGLQSGLTFLRRVFELT